MLLNGKPTELLLRSISDRLAGREDCRNITYTVRIDHTGVHMSPMILVFPNRYIKEESSKIDVVSWVHQYKLTALSLSDLVFGTYQFCKEQDAKKRRWKRCM